MTDEKTAQAPADKKPSPAAMAGFESIVSGLIDAHLAATPKADSDKFVRNMYTAIFFAAAWSLITGDDWHAEIRPQFEVMDDGRRVLTGFNMESANPNIEGIKPYTADELWAKLLPQFFDYFKQAKYNREYGGRKMPGLDDILGGLGAGLSVHRIEMSADELMEKLGAAGEAGKAH